MGLVGGIGSGKSLVARLMADHGGGVVSADALAQALLDEPPVVEQLRRWWGEQVVGADGRVDRRAVAEIVFRDAGQRRRLEGLIHPEVIRRCREAIRRLEQDPQVRFVVLDAPLLVEAGLEGECDSVVFVEAEEGVRAARVARERGWGVEELRRREAAQKSLDDKRRRADYIIENNSTIEALRTQVERLVSRLLEP